MISFEYDDHIGIQYFNFLNFIYFHHEFCEVQPTSYWIFFLRHFITLGKKFEIKPKCIPTHRVLLCNMSLSNWSMSIMISNFLFAMHFEWGLSYSKITNRSFAKKTKQTHGVWSVLKKISLGISFFWAEFWSLKKVSVTNWNSAGRKFNFLQSRSALYELPNQRS